MRMYFANSLFIFGDRRIRQKKKRAKTPHYDDVCPVRACVRAFCCVEVFECRIAKNQQNHVNADWIVEWCVSSWEPACVCVGAYCMGVELCYRILHNIECEWKGMSKRQNQAKFIGVSVCAFVLRMGIKTFKKKVSTRCDKLPLY